MTLNLAVAFFKSPRDQDLAPGAISTTKSALRNIFRYGFKFDLDYDLFASIPKACAMLHPWEFPGDISGSVSKVLKLVLSWIICPPHMSSFSGRPSLF